jgi:hypothetical protein
MIGDEQVGKARVLFHGMVNFIVVAWRSTLAQLRMSDCVNG